MKKKILKSQNIILVVNQTVDDFLAQFTEANCTYVISSELDLNGKTLTMPSDCVLRFECGGMLKNGTLSAYRTYIEAGNDAIFCNITFDRVEKLAPAFTNEVVRPEWFDVAGELEEEQIANSTKSNEDERPSESEDTRRINRCIEMASMSGNKIQLLPKIYEINRTINIYSGTLLEGTILGSVDRGHTQGTILKYTDTISKSCVAMDFYCAVDEGTDAYKKTCFKFMVSNLLLEYGNSESLAVDEFAESNDCIAIKLSSSTGSAPRTGLIENVKISGFGTGINVHSVSYVKFNYITINNCLTSIKIGKTNNETSTISHQLLEFLWFHNIIINVKRNKSDFVTGIELNYGNNLYFNEIDVNDCNIGYLIDTKRDCFNTFLNRLNITRCRICMDFRLNMGFVTRFRVSEVTLDYSSPHWMVDNLPILNPVYGLRFTRDDNSTHTIGDSSFSDIYDSTKYSGNAYSIYVDTAKSLSLPSCSFDRMRLLNPVHGVSNTRKLGILNFKSYNEIRVPANSYQSDPIVLMSTNIFKNGVYPMPIVTPIVDNEIPQVVFSVEGDALKMKLACQQISTVDRVYRFYFPQVN